jgi:hypothetical protein
MAAHFFALNRACLKVLQLTGLCVFSQLSQADVYTFTQLAGNGGAIDVIENYAINGLGEVAFDAFFDQGGRGLYVGKGGPPTLIVETHFNTSDPLYTVQSPTINDDGDVAFIGFTSTTSQVILRYNDASNTFTKIAETGQMTGGITLNVLCCHTAINDAGTVAFTHILPDFVASGSGGAITPIDVGPDLGGGLVALKGVSGMQVAYRDLGSGMYRILKGVSLSKSLIVESVPPFAPATHDTHYRPSISHSAVANGFIDDKSDVAFSAPLTAGGQGVFIGDGSSITTIVDSSGAFDTFGPVALGENDIAFSASLDFSGIRGVYNGPHPVGDKVLQQGDTVAGYAGTVQNVRSISSNSINDAGQIAIVATFSNGRQRLLRADPVTFTKIDESLVYLSTGLLYGFFDESLGQQADLQPGRQPFSFDYLFATTTGALEVWLAGRRIAIVTAPRRLAPRFRRFRGIVFGPRTPRSVPLEFRLVGNGAESAVLVDNVVFPGVDNGDFGTGDLSGWRTRVSERGSVGVAYAPGANTPPRPRPPGR